MKTTEIGGRNVSFWAGDKIDYVLIQPADADDLSKLERELLKIKEYAKKKNFLFAAFKINDWNGELSPWDAPAVFGDSAFGHGAPDTLKYVTDELIPSLKKEYSLSDDVKIIIGGYSLRAFFSVWAGYESDIFSAVRAASPSVWFEGWDEYMKTHTLKAEKVYLSVGNKEEKTKNPTMARVGDRLRGMNREYIEKLGENTILEINPGNHFVDSDIRTAKAFAWTLK